MQVNEPFVWTLSSFHLALPLNQNLTKMATIPDHSLRICADRGGTFCDLHAYVDQVWKGVNRSHQADPS
jgi:hypothetical protein